MKLLAPIQLGKLRLRNGVVMAPMTRNRADHQGKVSEITQRYYVQRASAGLIITEATNISPEAKGYPMTPGIWNSDQIESWKAVTSAVHAAGGLIVMQLWHTGRVGHSEVREGRIPVAPSAIAIQGQQHFTPKGLKDYEVPRALSTAEIRATVSDYEKAAQNAKLAGFDGVELHGAFGYLPHQFLVDSSNQRTDEYGGSIENRCRFVLEVMDRLVGVWGSGRVGIRLSPTISYNGMVDSSPLATFSTLIEKLNSLPLAYLHLMRATPDPQQFPSWPKDAISTFGSLYRGDLLVNGGYDRESAEEVLIRGDAKAVSFGAPFVSNPDLVQRMKDSAPLAAADRSTFYGGGEKGYIDYPALASHDPSEAKGYWLVQATVSDPSRFGKYTAVAGPVIASYGGRVLARGDVAEVVEGTVSGRPYFIKFPSYAAAMGCFHSVAYQEAISMRAGAAHFDIVVVEGYLGESGKEVYSMSKGLVDIRFLTMKGVNMQSSGVSASSSPREINPLVRIGAVLFGLWGVLHVWVLAEGFRQYFNGVHGQWEMFIGGSNAPRGAFQHAVDAVTSNVHSHLLLNFTTDVGGYGVLGFYVAWALWKRASREAYWLGLIVIGIADLAFLFFQVVPGIIEANAGTVGGPVIWFIACLITTFGLRAGQAEKSI